MQWWLQIGDKLRQGRRQGQAAKRPDPPSPENAVPAKTTPQKAKRKNQRRARPPTYDVSMMSVATQNLINMVAVCTVSGTVLLGLLAARHF
jgi:hypothetical protein